MRADMLEKLGKGVYRQSLIPYKPRRRKGVIVFGLDTEFSNDDDRTLLTWQISLDKEHTYIYKPEEKEYSWESIYQVSKNIIKDCNLKLSDYSLFVYAVYYSIAELQHLKWKESKLEIMSTHNANARKKITKRHSMYFFDVNTWYTGQSLEVIAKLFGLSKLKYDVTKLTNKDLKSQTFQEYAKNDAYIIGEILRRMRNNELKNSGIDILLTKTVANTAGAEYRAKYIKGKQGQSNTTLRRTALLASVGGRKEAFFRGELDNAYEYDAKSFYPNACILMEILPFEEDWHYAGSLEQLLNAKGGFGKFRFEYTENVTYPSLPVYSNEVTPRVFYPRRGITYCTSFEAREAIEQGAKLVLFKGWYYNTGTTSFADYLKTLIDWRASSNDLAESTLLKMKANHIIGKLTEKKPGYNINDKIDYSNKWGVPLELVNSMRGLSLKMKLSTGSSYYPEWNMLILGMARAIIGKLAKEVEALQIATDAVITTKYMGDRFTYEGIEFELKNEGSYKCYRAGLYQHGDKLKHQSISNNQVLKDIFSNFTPDIKVKFNSMHQTTIKRSIRTNEPLGSPYERPYTIDLHYDNKRELMANGYTRPWDSIKAIPEGE